MTRILLRSRKGPFEIASAEETLDRNLVAQNSGNLIFMAAAHKILSAPGVEVTPDRLHVAPGRADEINERFDAYVIPLANAFRQSFEPHLVRLTQLVERLRIPVVVLGVGAQSTLDFRRARLAPIERSVRRFVSAVLDRGPSIGVRGELTAEYLRSLGYRDVDVIGCPSMFLWGRDLKVEKRRPVLDRDARVAITISPYVRRMGDITTTALARYPNLVYVAQDLPSLALLVMGESRRDATIQSALPVHTSHPLFREDRVRYYLDPWRWIDDLRAVDFTFGTRIHGSIASLLAGTPAFVLGHDSRTLELARYHAIPHRPIAKVPGTVDPAELYAEADFGALNEGHGARYDTFTAYLARHGLETIFATPGLAAAYDARVAATAYPPAVTVSSARQSRRAVGSLLRRARYRLRTAATTHPTVRRLRTNAARRLAAGGAESGDEATGD